MKTFMANEKTVTRKWYVVDAEGITLGRLATEVASVLKGKGKPTYTPHVLCGDYVVVVNADKVVLTGNKWADKKYYSHSEYNGGLRTYNAEELMKRFPTRMVEKAVSGMLPHTKLGNQMRDLLFVYAGPEHPHQAQKPETLVIKK